jgi:hypothetical protein
VHRAYNLTTFIRVPIVLKSVSLNLLDPLGSFQICNGIALPLPFKYYSSLCANMVVVEEWERIRGFAAPMHLGRTNGPCVHRF